MPWARQLAQSAAHLCSLQVAALLSDLGAHSSTAAEVVQADALLRHPVFAGGVGEGGVEHFMLNLAQLEPGSDGAMFYDLLSATSSNVVLSPTETAAAAALLAAAVHLGGMTRQAIACTRQGRVSSSGRPFHEVSP